jgi:hypothetical protein
MNPYKVTITRTGTANNAQADADRLGVKLPDANGKYKATFEATLIHFEDGYGYCVKSDLTLVKAKLNEIQMNADPDFA